MNSIKYLKKWKKIENLMYFLKSVLLDLFREI